MDLSRNPELLFEPLLLGGLLEQILDAARHRVERFGEHTELVARLDRDAVSKVALADPPRAHEQGMHRPGDRLRQGEPHDQRDGLDDQEQATEASPDRQEYVDIAEPRLRDQDPAEKIAEVHSSIHADGAGRARWPIGVLEE